MYVILFLVLSIPGTKPVVAEYPMPSAFACLQEVNSLILRAEAMRKVGQIQAGCVVVGPREEIEH